MADFTSLGSDRVKALDEIAEVEAELDWRRGIRARGERAGTRAPAGKFRGLDGDALFEKLIELETSVAGPALSLESRDFVAAAAPGHAGLVQRNHSAVVALVLKSNLHRNGGSWALSGPMTQVPFELCEGERLFNRLAAANDSGVLVGGRTVLTAWHCIHRDAQLELGGPASLENLYFVFDYEMQQNGLDRTVFADTEVFDGAFARITDERPIGQGDWALVELDRDTGREPAEVRSAGQIEEGDEVYAIGHPLGTSKKVTSTTRVQGNPDPLHFLADLDVYERNSGSPVFNASNHQLEGIVLVGDSPLVLQVSRPCRRTRRCRGRRCQGEAVGRISQVAATAAFQSRR